MLLHGKLWDWFLNQDLTRFGKTHWLDPTFPQHQVNYSTLKISHYVKRYRTTIINTNIVNHGPRKILLILLVSDINGIQLYILTFASLGYHFQYSSFMKLLHLYFTEIPNWFLKNIFINFMYLQQISFWTLRFLNTLLS